MFSNTKNHLGFLILAILAVYSLSLNAPFYLDDFRSIQENYLLQTGSVQDFFLQNRFIGTMTFFVQEKLGINSVLEYRLVNISIHILNTFLVYLLVNSLLSLCGKENKTIAFFSALIFAIHPLNSQPVIYIVQRYSLMSAFFYLLCTLTYIEFRKAINTKHITRTLSFVLILIISMFLGWFSKQNFISVIFVLVILEILFFKRDKSYKTLYSSLLFLGVSLLIVSLTTESGKEFIKLIDSASRETKDISRLDYFFAQLNILWIYIGKFFAPIDLRLEYSIFSNSFSNLTTTVSFIGHLCLLVSSIVLFKKRPEITFAILFFYCGHMIESSIIPIRDFAFEHRTYISNFALSFLLISFVTECGKAFNKQKEVMALISITVVTYSVFTLHRAEMWSDKEAFFENEASLSPKNPRVLTSLAKIYRNNGKVDEANSTLELAYKYSNNKLRDDVASNYFAMLVEQKRVNEATEVAEKLLPQTKDLLSKNQILHNLGALYFQLGNLEQAKNYFKKVCNSKKPLPESYYSLAIIALKEKDLLKAESVLRKLVNFAPNYEAGNQLYLKVLEAKKMINRRVK
ncbi:tetratricopeptide repeat protein [Pseudoalteromonas sp. SSM20]